MEVGFSWYEQEVLLVEEELMIVLFEVEWIS